MVIIAVANLEPKCNLKDVVKKLASTIDGHFEALNFDNTLNKKNNTKTVYLQLADNLNVQAVIERLNKKKIRSVSLHAFIPYKVPAFLVSYKPRKIPMQMRRALKMVPQVSEGEVVYVAVNNIMQEMQSKFTGLYVLSHKTGHQLLDNIRMAIHERLYEIVRSNPTAYSGYKLTQSYRKEHPHVGDFQLIVTSLHAAQDAEGTPRALVLEEELVKAKLRKLHNDVPFEMLSCIVHRHVNRIAKKLEEHVTNLEVAPCTSTPEEATKMKVRAQLKKMKPYLQSYVKNVITSRIMPDKDKFSMVKVYGEPYLPGKDVLLPFTSQFRVVATIRSESMYNLISLKLHRPSLAALLKADGTVLRGATLVIRPITPQE